GIVPPDDRPGLARVWDMTTLKLLHSFNMPAGSTPIAVLSQDGRWLAAGNTAGGVRVGDLHSGRERQFRRGEKQAAFAVQDRSVACAALSPDGNLLATGGWDSRFTLWDLDNKGGVGKPGMWRATVLAGEVVSALAFSGDGKTLAFGTGGRAPLN